jgi:hypothetical protein
MDEPLTFDLYVEITDPSWSVEHETGDSRVEVVFGAPGESPPGSLLHLWFKDPDTVVTLGQELTQVGKRLAAQLRTSLSDSADSDQVSVSEEYPVPGQKPKGADGVGSGEEK